MLMITNPESEPKKKVSRFTVAGAILLPFGLLLLLLFIPFTMTSIVRIVLISMGVIALIGSTGLGILGISQIRNSSGKIYGMRLAVTLSLFYPIILISMLLFILGWTFFSSISSSSLIPLAWLVIVLLIDYFIVRATWNKAIS